MKIRMRSFGLVAVLVLAGCTKPEPQPQPQPEPLPEPQSESLTQAPQPVFGVELKAGAATASNACKTLAQSIGLTEQRRDELRRQIEGEDPRFGVDDRSLDVNPVYLHQKMALSTAEVELVELRARRSSQQCDDPTARLQTCKLPEELQSRIESYGKQLEALRLKYTDGHPDVVSLKESLNALVQQGLNECVEQIQKDSPGHI